MTMDADSPRTLAISTSGGDAPGMNAAIRAATMVATAAGWRVLGIRHGRRPRPRRPRRGRPRGPTSAPRRGCARLDRRRHRAH
ncbi:6-phosphofructokinase [Plesiocystis pacifica]|uniref:6-phosphofructokinase n=1 Tax=Plesiocystis pacifica TaxID=191768 RepID=UPI000A3077EC